MLLDHFFGLGWGVLGAILWAILNGSNFLFSTIARFCGLLPHLLA
jgi:hypothetical protein